MSLDTQGSREPEPVKVELEFKSPLRWMSKHSVHGCGGWFLADIEVSLRDVPRDHYTAQLGAYARDVGDVARARDVGDLIGPRASLQVCDCRCYHRTCDRHFSQCRCSPCETCLYIRRYCWEKFPDIKVRDAVAGSEYCDGCEGPLCRTCRDCLRRAVDWGLDDLCKPCRGKVLRAGSGPVPGPGPVPVPVPGPGPGPGPEPGVVGEEGDRDHDHGPGPGAQS